MYAENGKREDALKNLQGAGKKGEIDAEEAGCKYSLQILNINSLKRRSSFFLNSPILYDQWSLIPERPTFNERHLGLQN